MTILIYGMLVITILYILLILGLTFGWMSLGRFYLNEKKPATKVAIIIPARNEEQNITQCLESLCKQDYPTELYEICIIDDASTDATAQKVNEYDSQGKTVKLITLAEDFTIIGHKKRAIAEGIKQTNSKLIITTDADCIMNANWLKTIVNYYETYQVQMIAAPVRFVSEKNIFQQLISLEFLGLVASGAAAITLNRPIMCNGANIAFERWLVDDINQYESNERYASGDDIFLMHNVRYKLKGKIGFIRHQDAFVSSHAPENLKSFLNQRLRWVSKSRGYTDFFTLLTAFIIFFMNLALLVCAIISIWRPEFLSLGILLLVIKLFIDLPIITSFSYFSGKTMLLLYSIPIQLFNILYVPLIAIAGNLVNVKWKGRKVR